MNLERASQRAASVRGPKSAARLYNEIEYELALGEPEDHLESIGEQALVLLEQRFPGIRRAAREIEEPPSLSRRAGYALHGMSRPDVPAWAARHPKHHVHRHSRSRLLVNARAHPAATLATVTVSTILIVHFWTYIALAVIAFAAIRASRVGQR
jgi:hypothetical protein